MTVHELIAQLGEMPQDFQVVHAQTVKKRTGFLVVEEVYGVDALGLCYVALD